MARGMKFDKVLKQQLLDEAVNMADTDPDMKPGAMAEALHKKYAGKMLHRDGSKPSKNDFTESTVKTWLNGLKKGKPLPKKADKVKAPARRRQGVDGMLEHIEQIEDELLRELASEAAEVASMQNDIEGKVAKVAKKLKLTEDEVRKRIREM